MIWPESKEKTNRRRRLAREARRANIEAPRGARGGRRAATAPDPEAETEAEAPQADDAGEEQKDDREGEESAEEDAAPDCRIGQPAPPPIAPPAPPAPPVQPAPSATQGQPVPPAQPATQAPQTQSTGVTTGQQGTTATATTSTAPAIQGQNAGTGSGTLASAAGTGPTTTTASATQGQNAGTGSGQQDSTAPTGTTTATQGPQAQNVGTGSRQQDSTAPTGTTTTSATHGQDAGTEPGQQTSPARQSGSPRSGSGRKRSRGGNQADGLPSKKMKANVDGQQATNNVSPTNDPCGHVQRHLDIHRVQSDIAVPGPFVRDQQSDDEDVWRAIAAVTEAITQKVGWSTVRAHQSCCVVRRHTPQRPKSRTKSRRSPWSRGSHPLHNHGRRHSSWPHVSIHSG